MAAAHPGHIDMQMISNPLWTEAELLIHRQTQKQVLNKGLSERKDTDRRALTGQTVNLLL